MDNGVPSLLMQAAQSAAQADGVASVDNANGMSSLMPGMAQNQGPPSQAQQPKKSSKKKGPPLRRGKWTAEEEAYAARLIQEFKAGLLPLTDGTTLRTFLSKLLNCDPMRISKKFVGANCIGKQVFRRRTADLNRLTPEQIQKSRAELSELERRFLERVAQTNRVKSSGVASGGPGPAAAQPDGLMKKDGFEGMNNATPPSPPWLQPPLGYKHGGGAAMAAANLAGGGVNSRAAAAGRALLGNFNSSRNKGLSSGISPQNSAGLLAMAELQRRASQQSLLQSLGGGNSTSNFFASQNSMGNLGQNSSAARLAGLNGNGSLSNMLKGMSRDQLNQLARDRGSFDRGISSASLSNMVERKNSFEALMGLDFQSLQSIDNLANLVQSGSFAARNVPSSGMKNADFASSGSLSNAARRLASAGNMESLLRSFSSNNVNKGNNRNGGENDGKSQNSNANLHSLLQNMQNGNSMSGLLGSGNAASAASLANLLRDNNSSTGLSAMRGQDGLNQRNSSVEDFLNLVADGYIPHQDPSMLSIPLMHQNNNGQGSGGNGGGNNNAAAMLAQQQLLAQATGNSQLANALASRSFGNLARNTDSLSNSDSTSALFAQAAGGHGASS
eukprot:CAMPEP_0176160540 /NCGR_PEP_ID=MMETSP0120_2-20121206/82122_1 /TAXON_ID=160619 /ORGANISM="Kryptoperidinium foliaceum, Strain CCMP 1326" /LENGTH=614 /DNA_ID=CAMNT_0017497977 /DNA_START=58 /DNA_END=1899 /DNA_ORIENTATION=-